MSPNGNPARPRDPSPRRAPIVCVGESKSGLRSYRMLVDLPAPEVGPGDAHGQIGGHEDRLIVPDNKQIAALPGKFCVQGKTRFFCKHAKPWGGAVFFSEIGTANLEDGLTLGKRDSDVRQQGQRGLQRARRFGMPDLEECFGAACQSAGYSRQQSQGQENPDGDDTAEIEFDPFLVEGSGRPTVVLLDSRIESVPG